MAGQPKSEQEIEREEREITLTARRVALGIAIGKAAVGMAWKLGLTGAVVVVTVVDPRWVVQPIGWLPLK